MCHDETGVSCKLCSRYVPVGAVQLAELAKLTAYETQLIGGGRFLAYIQRATAPDRSVSAASLASAQLQAV